MTPKKKMYRYIPYALLLATLLLGIFGYSHYKNVIDELKSKLSIFDQNTKVVEAEFGKVNDEYHSMMATLSDKDKLLIEKQTQLSSLQSKLETVLKKQNITQNDLAEAKSLIAVLKKEIAFSKKENVFNDKIAAYKNKLDSIQKAFNLKVAKHEKEIKDKEKNLALQHKTISQKDKVIQRGATLRLINFSIKGVNVKANGKEVETDKARKADKLKVSFEVNDNNISESGDKKIYLCIYDVNSKLLNFKDAQSGELELQSGQVINYSDVTTFYYNKGERMPVSFDWENDDFEKGDYKIEVYQNGTLIGSEVKSFR